MTGTAGVQTTGPIREAWKQFWTAICEPWTALLLLSTLVLFAITQAEIKGAANTLVQVLLAASSGVLGGRLANRISATTGEGILLARGTVSVRSLKVLHQYAGALRERVVLFLEQKDLIQGNPEATARAFEEVIAGCSHIQAQAVSSMDNWTDTVPAAARIVADIGVANAANAEVAGAEELVGALQEELRSVRESAREAGDAHERELAAAQGALAEAKVQLAELRANARQANTRVTSEGVTFKVNEALWRNIINATGGVKTAPVSEDEQTVERLRRRIQEAHMTIARSNKKLKIIEAGKDPKADDPSKPDHEDSPP